MKKNLSIKDLLLLDTELAIKWNDDEQTFISLKILRDHCPCAFCSGETDALGNIYKGSPKKLGENGYTIVKLEKVGHYAVRIFWGDHHTDGLFTYEFLRKLGDI